MAENRIDKISRRSFLKGASVIAGAGFGLPYIVGSSAIGSNGPSNRVNIGCIGVGRMGLADISDIQGFGEVQIIAVCDVDAKRAEHARQVVEKRYSDKGDRVDYKGCTSYGDFRELLERRDIDAVMICTPDHWHVLCAVAAAKAGKDIFLQKPLSLTIEEGRILSETVKRYGRIFMGQRRG